MDLVRTHHVLLDSQFSSLVMGIIVLEGLGRQLDPDLDIFAVSLPLLKLARDTDVKLPTKLLLQQFVNQAAEWVGIKSKIFV